MPTGIMHQYVCVANTSHVIHEVAVPMAQSIPQYSIHTQSTAVSVAKMNGSTQYAMRGSNA